MEREEGRGGLVGRDPRGHAESCCSPPMLGPNGHLLPCSPPPSHRPGAIGGTPPLPSLRPYPPPPPGPEGLSLVPALLPGAPALLTLTPQLWSEGLSLTADPPP